MADPNELLYDYFDGNKYDTDPLVSNASQALRQTGVSIIPMMLSALKKRLHEYRSYTKSNAELRDFIKQAKEIIGDGSTSDYFNELYGDKLKELNDDDHPGISAGQRIVSLPVIHRAVSLIESNGDASEQLLLSYLNNPDYLLIISLILFYFKNPSPYVLKTLVSHKYLHIDVRFVQPQDRIIFYLFLFVMAHAGDEDALKVIEGDARNNGVDPEYFEGYILDMAIYIASTR